MEEEEEEEEDAGPGQAGVGLRVAVYWVEERRTFSGQVNPYPTPRSCPSLERTTERSGSAENRPGTPTLSTPPVAGFDVQPGAGTLPGGV